MINIKKNAIVFFVFSILICLLYCVYYNNIELQIDDAVEHLTEPLTELSGGYNDKQILLNTLQNLNKDIEQLL